MWVVPLVVLLGGPLWAALPPAVHTELRQATPEPGGTSERAIDEIVLAFTTTVEAPLSQILIYGPDDVPVATGPVEHPSEGSDHLRVQLEVPAGPGNYRVEWRTVAPDGHVVQGSYSFEVVTDPADEVASDIPSPDQETAIPSDTTAELEVAPPAASDPDRQVPARDDVLAREADATPPVGTATRWIQMLGAVLLIGAGAFHFGVLRRFSKGGGLPEARARMRAGLARFAAIGVFLLLVAAPLKLRNQLADLGAGVGWNETSYLLLRTAWGAGWFVHLIVVALGVVGLILAASQDRGERGWQVLGLAALLVPLVSVLQGHAWGAEGVRVLAASSLYLHVSGVGIWLGGLILLVLVGIPSLRSTPALADQEDRSAHALPAIARLVNAFSRIALLAVLLIVLTGSVNAWLLVGGTDGLFGTTYGRTLFLKLGVILVAFTLGFYNWRRVRPALAERPDPGTLRIPASVEAALGIVVLLITAVLVATPPP